MACILLTGGRAPVSLDLARAFSRHGHRVLIAESQSAQVSRSSRAVHKTFYIAPPRQRPEEFVQRLVEICQTEAVDVLIPTCEEVFYVSRARARFPSQCQVWVDDFKKIGSLHDKWLFNQEASKLGLATPDSYLIKSRSDLDTYSDLSGVWILKPTYSRFGHNILQGTLTELRHTPLDFSNNQTWVLQRFVRGPEYCTYAIAKQGQLLALSIYDHAFVAGKAGICFQEVDCPAIEGSLREYLAKLEFTGQIAFDFIVHGGVAYALECNPRATSGIHLLAAQPGFVDIFTAPRPTSAALVRAPLGSRAMLGLAMLTFALGQITSMRRLRDWLKILISSHEVMFSWRDPMPFFDQLLCLLQLAWQSRRSGLDLLSASTADIEWNGEA